MADAKPVVANTPFNAWLAKHQKEDRSPIEVYAVYEAHDKINGAYAVLATIYKNNMNAVTVDNVLKVADMLMMLEDRLISGNSPSTQKRDEDPDDKAKTGT